MKKFEIDGGVLYLGFQRPKNFIPIKERKQWVRALKSGKYKKGVTALRRTDDTYCCLGVKMDLEGFVWDISHDPPCYHCIIDGYRVKAYYRGKCEAISSVGEFPHGTYFELNNEKHTCLVEVNDELGKAQKGFDTIAQIIDIIWDRKTWEK